MTDHDLLELAAPAVQGEPVAWYLPGEGGYDSQFRDHATVISCTGNPWEGWLPLYAAPQPAEQQPAPVFSDEDHVSMPRGLIAAACSAIDKKRDAENVLSELRRYTLGDLSRQTEPDVAALVETLEHISGGCQRRDMPSEADIAEWAERIDAALATHRKGSDK